MPKQAKAKAASMPMVAKRNVQGVEQYFPIEMSRVPNSLYNFLCAFLPGFGKKSGCEFPPV